MTIPDPLASREALATVDRYLAALNARDTAAIRDAFNFPHLRIGANGNLARYATPLRIGANGNLARYATP